MGCKVAKTSLALKPAQRTGSPSTFAGTLFAHSTTPYCRLTVCQTQLLSQGLSS